MSGLSDLEMLTECCCSRTLQLLATLGRNTNNTGHQTTKYFQLPTISLKYFQETKIFPPLTPLAVCPPAVLKWPRVVAGVLECCLGPETALVEPW